MIGHRDDIAGPYRVGMQASRVIVAGELISNAHCSCLPVAGSAIMTEAAMGIDPLQFLDRALCGSNLGLVEHGKGMMRKRGRCDCDGDGQNAADGRALRLIFVSCVGW